MSDETPSAEQPEELEVCTTHNPPCIRVKGEWQKRYKVIQGEGITTPHLGFLGLLLDGGKQDV